MTLALKNRLSWFRRHPELGERPPNWDWTDTLWVIVAIMLCAAIIKETF